jgi:hypothetical protein
MPAEEAIVVFPLLIYHLAVASVISVINILQQLGLPHGKVIALMFPLGPEHLPLDLGDKGLE